MPPAAIPAISSPISGAPSAPTAIASPSATVAAPPRVLSVDVLRGLTIALMILVNDPGDWAHTYTQLDHAKWNGFTLTDFVFPNFLFLVGVSIIFSLQSRIARSASGILDKATKKTLALHIFRRAFLIFAIKMFLTAFPYFHYTHFRIYGVLTRIALCYLAAGLICLVVWNATQRARTLIAITAALLIGYWALMRFVPVPGLGTPTHDFPILDPDRNLTAWLDRAISAFTQSTIHTGTLYEHTRDPEGLLSTLPAIATTLIGCLTGLWLTRAVPHDRRAAPIEGSVSDTTARNPTITPTRCLSGLILAGIASIAAGLLWNLSFPINKNLWTSSFVLYRRRMVPPHPRPLLLAHRHAPPQRHPRRQSHPLALARLRLQRHHRLRRLQPDRQNHALDQGLRQLLNHRQTRHRLALDLPSSLRPQRQHQHHLASLRHRRSSSLLPPQLAPLAQTHLPQSLIR